MDFSQLNFTTSCEENVTYNYASSTLTDTSSEKHCYNPAVSFLMICIAIALFFFAMYAGYKLFSGKKLPV